MSSLWLERQSLDSTCLPTCLHSCEPPSAHHTHTCANHTPLLSRVLAAYPYVRREAAFTYDSGLEAPNPAALGREAGRTGAPAMLAARIRASRQLLGTTGGSQEERRPGKQQQQQQRRGAVEAREASDTGEEGELPPAGSYAAALLAAFDDDAVRAARVAVAALKQELMQHNMEAARQLLADTAAAAAVAAS